MGAVVPLLTSTLISQGVAMATRSTGNSQALSQLQARQDLQNRQAAAEAALAREQIALNSAQANEDRKKALKRAVARQRASFGGQGVGTGTGSSQAVLLGMFEESEDEQRKRDELDSFRLKSIDQDLSQSRALNVLQRTQLEEKTRLDSYTNLGNRITTALF
ncbi:MAG: hypothetical protein ACRBDI_03455 [Alphaproteobacteria bacterium]